MITEQIFYGVRCDRCRDDYESSGDYSYMYDKGEIEEAAESDEWLEIDGRHYCPHCYEEDPLKNEYDDDDHDYTPKPPIPECIFKMRRVVGMMIGQADGEMRETTDDHLHVRFYMNQHPLNDTLLAIIDEMLGDLPHTVVVDEEPHKYDDGVTRRLHIDVSMNFIHKGDHIRVIEHWGYKDAFGKEGIVKKIHTNGTLTIEIRDDDGELRLRSCGAKSLELIKKQRMFDNLKCRLGFHKPAQYHQTFKHKCRTTNKGRSKKRWTTWAKEIVTVTYCERCGKTLRTKRRWRWR